MTSRNLLDLNGGLLYNFAETDEKYNEQFAVKFGKG